jgi:hypothetical protein
MPKRPFSRKPSVLGFTPAEVIVLGIIVCKAPFTGCNATFSLLERVDNSVKLYICYLKQSLCQNIRRKVWFLWEKKIDKWSRHIRPCQFNHEQAKCNFPQPGRAAAGIFFLPFIFMIRPWPTGNPK